MDFEKFRDEMVVHFEMMKMSRLYIMDVSPDELWQHYLASFPGWANPKFRERTEHDCSACKNFIRNIGMAVVISNGQLVSLWDFTPSDPTYAVVARAMSEYVKAPERKIKDIYLHYERSVGIKQNYEAIGDTPGFRWTHFHVNLGQSDALVTSKDRLQEIKAKCRENVEMLDRALKTITLEAMNEVIELVVQGSLYRGDEHVKAVRDFRFIFQQAMDEGAYASTRDYEMFLWKTAYTTAPNVLRIRNSVIGTLLVGLSMGQDLEVAVREYESKVAPHNYQRPKSLITKGMVEKANKTLTELGYLDAIERRHARIGDLTVNNVLFVDRSALPAMNPLERLAAGLPVSTSKSFDRVEEITIDMFIRNVLPTVESMEVLFENKHLGNLVNLIAPVNAGAKGMFNWNNNFSWSYRGEVADSIKERVKAAGGNVTGDLRCSLSWFNTDDLDLHMVEPDGTHIFFGDKMNRRTGGNLDVDMNVTNLRRDAVENISYPDRDRMQNGQHVLSVHNYRHRENIDVGFEVEIEADGQIMTLSYSDMVKSNERVKVATVHYNRHSRRFEITPHLDSKPAQKQAWDLKTGTWVKTNLVCLSPNFWDKQCAGNLHYFFMLDDCKSDQPARGFFNEFLRSELKEHRKVFEVLAGKMAVQPSQEQLAGLGFSSTGKGTLTVKVSGAFTRVLNIIF